MGQTIGEYINNWVKETTNPIINISLVSNRKFINVVFRGKMEDVPEEWLNITVQDECIDYDVMIGKWIFSVYIDQEDYNVAKKLSEAKKSNWLADGLTEEEQLECAYEAVVGDLYFRIKENCDKYNKRFTEIVDDILKEEVKNGEVRSSQ